MMRVYRLSCLREFVQAREARTGIIKRVPE